MAIPSSLVGFLVFAVALRSIQAQRVFFAEETGAPLESSDNNIGDETNVLVQEIETEELTLLRHQAMLSQVIGGKIAEDPSQRRQLQHFMWPCQGNIALDISCGDAETGEGCNEGENLPVSEGCYIRKAYNFTLANVGTDAAIIRGFSRMRNGVVLDFLDLLDRGDGFLLSPGSRVVLSRNDAWINFCDDYIVRTSVEVVAVWTDGSICAEHDTDVFSVGRSPWGDT